MLKNLKLSFVFSLFLCSTALAITDEQKKHEDELTKLATQRCNSELIEGSDYSVTALSDGKVEVNFFGKKGGELKGKFVYEKSAWEGRQKVLREHQAEESKNRRECIREELKSLRETYKAPDVKKPLSEKIQKGSTCFALIYMNKDCLGTLARNSTYTVKYSTAFGYTVSGHVCNTHKQNTANYGNANPSSNTISLWGAVFNFDENGSLTHLNDRNITGTLTCL